MCRDHNLQAFPFIYLFIHIFFSLSLLQKIVGTPSDTRRPANIVGGVTSFIKTQPTRPTREDMEKVRLQELQRKKEYEEETLRKKEQLLWAKAEERKR